MFPEPHALPTRRPARRGIPWYLRAALCVCAAWLAGCATAPIPPNVALVTTAAPAIQPTPEPAVAPPGPLAAESDEPTTPPKDLLRDTLAYADRTLSASSTELARETARLSDLDENKPSRAMRLALVLAQTRQPADTARALGLVQRTLTNTTAKNLPPLARLLEARLTQQRRLEEQLERQAQQLRDAQRRNDQLSERLEAVRAIERSLTTRPAPAAPVTPPPGAAASGAGNNGNAKP